MKFFTSTGVSNSEVLSSGDQNIPYSLKGFILLFFLGTFGLFAQETVTDIFNLPEPERCVSNDLRVVNASLDYDLCGPICVDGQIIEYPLTLAIFNNTGSERTSFAFYARLEQYNPDGTLEATYFVSGCKGPVPPNTTTSLTFEDSLLILDENGEPTEFDGIPYLCGGSLKLINLYEAWTDASDNDNRVCPLDASKIAPKCDVLPSIEIQTPISVFVEAKSDVSCYGLEDGAIDITVNGGIEPYSYVWTMDGNPGFTSSSEDLVNLAPGTYNVEVTDAEGCKASETGIIIGEPDPVEAGTGSDDSYCISDTGLASVDLAALLSGEDSGGVWTDEEDDVVNSPINLSAFAAGEYTFTYTVTLQGNSDCFDSSEVTITIYDDVEAGTGSDDSYCITDAGLASVDLAALVSGEDGGGVWTDEEDDVVSSPINLSAFAAGEYTFTYTVSPEAGSDCLADHTEVTITIYDDVDAGTGSDDSYCITDSGLASVDLAALVSGEDGGGVWTNEEDDVVSSPINLSAFSAGEYTFTYTVSPEAGSDCLADHTEVTITIYDDAEAGTGSDDSYCITDAGLASVDLAALVSGEDGGGVWTDEEDDVVSSPINLSAFAAGEYTFTYTVSPEAGSDCLADHTEVTITIYDDVDAGTGSDDSYCITDSGLASVDLAALVSGEDGGGVWTNEEDDVVSSPINLSAFSAGEYTFTYTVSPEAGSDCLADHTEVTITIYDDAEAGTGSDDSYCITDAGLASVDLAALVSGEDGGGVWTDEEDDVVSSPINLSAFAAGEYTFTYTVSPEAGSDCLADHTEVTITIYDDVDAGTGSDDSYCITDSGLASVDLAALVSGEDGGGVWTNEEDDVVSSPINLSAFSAGEYTFTYTVSPEAGSDCLADHTEVTITIYDDAEAGTGSDDSYCITDAGLASVDLAALVSGEDGGGVWTNEEDDVVSSPINLSAFAAGEYTFTYTVSPEAGSDCLADHTEVTITIIPSPETPDYQTTQADCLGGNGSLAFTNLDPGNFYYDLIGDNAGFILYTGEIPLSVGTHTFVVKYGEDGCESEEFDVTIVRPQQVEITLNYNVDQPDCESLLGTIYILNTEVLRYTVTNTGTNFVYYNNVAYPNSGFQNLPPGEYFVEGESVDGCTSGNALITLLEPECIVFEGCTLGYWKNHTDRWCDAYETCTRYGDVFENAPAQLKDLSLLEVLNLGGGGIYNLGRQSVAALLNTCHADVNYEILTTEELIAYVNANFSNAGSAGSYLDELNNAGCTLGGSRATTAPSEGCDPVDSGNGNNGNNGKPGKKDDSSVSKADFSAYPVPFKETLNIKYEFDYQSQATIEFFDMRGQLLRTVKEAKAFKGKVTTVNIDFSMRANQMYVIKVTTDRETFVKQIISGR